MSVERRLDSRVWLLWAAATTVPPLIGRNPFVVAEVLMIAGVVRAAWMPVAPALLGSWGWVIRLAAIFTLFGGVFNALTVHAGDIVLGRLPERLPLVGGPITLNAVLFGLLSGAALLAIVMVGTTAGAMLDWQAMMRLLPERVASLAVAGSVAWSFLPGTAAAWREIREAQAARGHPLRGPRDVPPLLVPLLDGGLERALTMAEVLEARGFGAEPWDSQSTRPTTRIAWRGVALVSGVASAALVAYAVAVGAERLALVAAVLAVIALGPLLVDGGHQTRRTRYRVRRWTTADTLVTGCAGAALATTLLRGWMAPAGLRYEPYPSLGWPAVDLPLILGLALLLAPTLAVPTPSSTGTELRR